MLLVNVMNTFKEKTRSISHISDNTDHPELVDHLQGKIVDVIEGTPCCPCRQTGERLHWMGRTLAQGDLWAHLPHLAKQSLDTPRISALDRAQQTSARPDASLGHRVNIASCDRHLTHPVECTGVRLPRYPRLSAADEASRSRRSSSSISLRVLFLRRPLGQMHSSFAFSHALQTGLSPEHLARFVRQRKQASETRFSLAGAGDCRRLDSEGGEADTVEESDMMAVVEEEQFGYKWN